MMKKLQNNELNRKSVEEFKQSKKTPVVVVLDNIRSLNNIGSVFRTADAFLLEAVFLCGITAYPPHKDIHKTALGATKSVTWKYFESAGEAITILKPDGYVIISLEQTNKSIFLQDFKIDKTKKYALVFGNEVKGVQQSIIDQSDHSIEIPQYGTKHSFNISVSVGIVLWEFYRRFYLS